MYIDDLKTKLAARLGLSPDAFVYPPQAELGDLSIPLFTLSKERGMSPVDLAQSLTQELESNGLVEGIAEVKAAGPYLNFFVDSSYLAAAVISEIEKKADDYGNTTPGEERVMLEYSNANTHKEYHIGHLRNLFFGDAVSRILSSQGKTAIPVSYINDFGIHTAKTIWYWRHHPESIDKDNPGRSLGKCYTAAAQSLEDNKEAKEEVSQIMKGIESRQGEVYKLWQESRAWSISYFDSIYKHFNIKFEQIFYESDLIDDGLAIAKSWQDKGIIKESEGAIIADLNDDNLGVLPIIRSDGTALYPVADIALATKKFKDFNLDESIYIVDIRQSLYFKQLSKLLEKAGNDFKISHLSYDFVTLKSGMMASRSGNVITYDQIWQEAFSRAEQGVSSRHEDWSEKKIKEVADKIAIAALKFEMLKVSSDKVITFDIDEALRFEGYTAAYLQYSGARLSSIIRKAGKVEGKLDPKLLSNAKEKKILWHLAQYQEVLKKADLKRDPSFIARYLFELSQSFNDYYHEVPVLKAEASLVASRLALLGVVRQVLKNAFMILGFTYLEEM